jgi:cobalt-zinc-cadmium efflux system outer membrane protein
MKFCLKAPSYMHISLLTRAITCLCIIANCLPVQATGYIGRPAAPTSLPGPVVPPAGIESGIHQTIRSNPTFIPDNGDHNPPMQDTAKSADNSAGERTKVQGTIQYDVSLAPISTQPGLSVVQSMNEALMNSPKAAAIRAQFGIARTNYAYAATGPNPIMFMDRGIMAEQEERLGPTLTVEPPWKLAFRLLSTKRLVDQTKIDLLFSLWSLRADVRRAYVEVIVAQETLKTLNELYDLSAKLLAVAEKRFHAGDVPELDMLKARLANTQNEVELGVGQKRVLRSYQQLNVIMGKSVDEHINVPALPGFTGKSSAFNLNGQKSDILPDFDRPIPALRYFIDIAFDNRLDLKSLLQQIRVNKANLNRAYGNILPNPNLTFGHSSSGNAPTGPKLSSWFYTLNAECPIANWNQGDIFHYRATGTQLHYQVGAQRNQITSDVSSAYQNLIAQREKIRSYQEHVLADSYEVARLARRSYEVGQSDITSTLQAQQANVQIRVQYLDAVTSYSQAFTDLEQACGRPLQ